MQRDLVISKVKQIRKAVFQRDEIASISRCVKFYWITLSEEYVVEGEIRRKEKVNLTLLLNKEFRLVLECSFLWQNNWCTFFFRTYFLNWRYFFCWILKHGREYQISWKSGRPQNRIILIPQISYQLLQGHLGHHGLFRIIVALSSFLSRYIYINTEMNWLYSFFLN